MRVLLVNIVCGSGSTGRIAADICRMLDARGGSGMVAYGRGGAPGGIQSVRIAAENGVRLHAGLSRITDRAGFYSKKAVKRLERVIREYRPDIIHLHNIHGYYIHVTELFRLLGSSGIPVVWTLHDCWAFTGHCAYYSRAGCARWQTECHDCPQRGQYPKSVLADSARKNYREKKAAFSGVKNMQLIAVSDWLKNEISRSFLKDYPVTRIYNGIDTALFRPIPGNVRERLGINGRFMVLSAADHFDGRKGLGDIMAAARRLPDAAFVIVGLSDAQIARLPENCIGMARTESQEALIELYTAADVFFNASSEETFGLVTAEAIACGTPAVVYGKTACPEPVTPGTGIIADDLAGAIEGLIHYRDNPTAVQLDAALFDKEKRLDDLYGLYCAVIGRAE